MMSGTWMFGVSSLIVCGTMDSRNPRKSYGSGSNQREINLSAGLWFHTVISVRMLCILLRIIKGPYFFIGLEVLGRNPKVVKCFGRKPEEFC